MLYQYIAPKTALIHRPVVGLAAVPSKIHVCVTYCVQIRKGSICPPCWQMGGIFRQWAAVIKAQMAYGALGWWCVLRISSRNRSNGFKEPLLLSNVNHPEPNYKTLFSSNLRYLIFNNNFSPVKQNQGTLYISEIIRVNMWSNFLTELFYFLQDVV